jgi:hypothetical protein
VSCPSAGNCVAGGGDVDGSQAFIAVESSGAWAVQQVPGIENLDLGLYSEVFSVSCPSAGNCAAAGIYDTRGNQQPFVIDEIDGTWGEAQEVPGIAALDEGNSAGTESDHAQRRATAL